MLQRSGLSLLLGAAAGLVSNGARAAPLDDYQRGALVHLSSAALRVEGNDYYTRNYTVAKEPGSLDVVVNLRDVGIAFDRAVRLRGSVVGGRLIWGFDEAFTPWLDLGGGNFIKHVTGSFVASVRPSAGIASLECSDGPCDYSAAIENEPGGYVTVWGRTQDTIFGWFHEDWEISSTDLEFKAFGGLPRPPLAALEIEAPAPGRFCSSDHERAYAARVRLSGPAPHDGVWVNVGSDHPTALRTRRVRVEPGADTASFPLYFPGDFSGAAHVGAASGGVSLSRSLDLPLCLPDLDERYLVDDYYNDRFGTCDVCMTTVRLNDAGTAIIRSDKDWLVDRPGVGTEGLDKVVGQGSVLDAYVNAFGDLGGLVQALSGERVGFRVRGWPQETKVELFAGVEPRAIDDLGVLFGTCKGTVNGPCFHDGAWPGALPVPGALSAPLTTLLGVAVGEFATPKGPRAYRLAGGDVKELEGFGGETRVAAVNQAGDAVGWSLTNDKLRRAAVFPAGAPKAEPLGSLPGFAQSEATGVSERGVVAGTASNANGGRRAFVAVPGKGMVALETRVNLPPGSKLELHEALSISRDGTVVARGVRDGARGTFVLHPAK